jgi:hypothetical protein
VRAVVWTLVAVLGYGTVVHVVQLADRFPPYPWAPGWLAAYFTALTVADPVAAALLWARRRVGLYLAVAVLVTDAAANAYAIYGLDGGNTAGQIGQVVVSLIAVAAVATAPWIRPHLR